MRVRYLVLAAILASSISAIVVAGRRESLSISGSLQVNRGDPVASPLTQNGHAAPKVVCRRTLRVVDLPKWDPVLNLRKWPSAQAPIVFGIAGGSRGLIDLEDQRGSWKKIAFRGETGFVHTAFVTADAQICMPVPGQDRPGSGSPTAPGLAS
jgi:hypothetical protein